MTFLEPVTLGGTYAVLEPLARSHGAELAEAVRDGELWKLWYTRVPAPQEMPEEITLRDTCVYSIVAPEWPTVRAHLRFELERRGS